MDSLIGQDRAVDPRERPIHVHVGEPMERDNMLGERENKKILKDRSGGKGSVK